MFSVCALSVVFDAIKFDLPMQISHWFAHVRMGEDVVFKLLKSCVNLPILERTESGFFVSVFLITL
jgi:hypothetical protein